MTDQLLVGLLFASIISVSSFLTRLLTLGGAVAQFVLGAILLGFGGWQWTVPMLVFFILSSLISKIKKRNRTAAESFFEKSSRRDAGQVIANGGIAGAITLIWFFTNIDALYIAHLGAIAAATADTWGTEIGTHSRSSPVLITTFKRAEAGRSGAVSLLGIFAGVVGSLVVWMSALHWISSLNSLLPIAIVVGGLMGSLVDSLLGATVQVQYSCKVCLKMVERRNHCGSDTAFDHGLRWMENDAVNLLCTFSGAFFALVFSMLV